MDLRIEWATGLCVLLFACATALAADGPATTQPVADDPANPASTSYRYVGRIDFANPGAPKLYYAGSYIVTSFNGTSLSATFDDSGDFWAREGNHVGFIIDGGDCIDMPLAKGKAGQVLSVGSKLSPGKHTLTIVRLCGPGAGYGTLIFHGLALDEGKRLSPPAALPARKIEVYGDSVTEGTGATCPEGVHDKGTGSGYLSYANVLARRLDAQVHNVGIGGLAVRDNFGSYNGGKTQLETTYNKLKPFPPFTDWDFGRYKPDLVIFAMGVNDNSAKAFADPDAWKKTFKTVISDVSKRYGKDVPIVLTVAPIWAKDAYVHTAKLADELKSEGMKVYYYKFSFEVSGHPNNPESDKMARELEQFIRANKLWPEAATTKPTSRPSTNP